MKTRKQRVVFKFDDRSNDKRPIGSIEDYEPVHIMREGKQTVIYIPKINPPASKGRTGTNRMVARC